MEHKQTTVKDILPKLIISTDNFIPRKDGITRFLSMVIPKLKKNFDITIICPDFENNNVDMDGVKFVRIPLKNNYIGDFKPTTFQPKLIKKTIKNADIVFNQTIGPIGGLSLYYAQKKKIKNISFIHSIDWNLVMNAISTFFFKKWAKFIVKIVAKYLYRRCNYLILPSRRTAELFSWEHIATNKKIIHLGVDSETFIPYYRNSHRNDIRTMFEIKDSDVVIGYHGRLAKEKDIYTLLRAFVKLRNKHKNIKLMILGSGIPKIAADLAKQKGVIHIPAKSAVANFLSAMDIYALPSLTETTSLSTLEAMSTGLPIVTTGVGFIKDYVKNGKNGYIFKKQDSFDLAKKLEYLIIDKHKRKVYGDNCRSVVKEKFKWEKTFERLTEFLLEVLEEKNEKKVDKTS